MSKVTIMDHPLIQHKLTFLRNEKTGSLEFRNLVGEIAMLMCYEATRDLPLKEVETKTPVAIAKTKVISGKKLAFVPILRAGLGMVDGVIAAEDTKQAVASAVDLCSSKRVAAPTRKHVNFVF